MERVREVARRVSNWGRWGADDERGHFDHWGGGHIHTFPNEGSAHGTVVFQPGDIVILARPTSALS